MSGKEGSAARVLEGQGGLRVRVSELRPHLLSADLASDDPGETPQAPLIHLLNQERKRSKLSVTELAERCGMKRQQLSRILSGSANPTLVTTCRIAEALGLELTLTVRA